MFPRICPHMGDSSATMFEKNGRAGAREVPKLFQNATVATCSVFCSGFAGYVAPSRNPTRTEPEPSLLASCLRYASSFAPPLNAGSWATGLLERERAAGALKREAGAVGSELR